MLKTTLSANNRQRIITPFIFCLSFFNQSAYSTSFPLAPMLFSTLRIMSHSVCMEKDLLSRR